MERRRKRRKGSKPVFEGMVGRGCQPDVEGKKEGTGMSWQPEKGDVIKVERA